MAQSEVEILGLLCIYPEAEKLCMTFRQKKSKLNR